MFRFIGLVWDVASPGSSAAAIALARSLATQRHWQTAFSRPGLLVCTTGTQPGVNEAHPLHDNSGVVLGKLFHRHALAGASHHPWSPQRITFGAAESAEITMSAGRALVDGYWGRYVAFLDAGIEGARVLRDPSGTIPCHLIQHEGVSIVFSWLDDVLTSLPQVPCPRVSWEGLAGHLAFGELVGRQTALDGVSQVLGGEVVHITSGELHSTLLWNAAEKALSPNVVPVEEAAGLLRGTVQACVQAWASCYDTLLLRLSGGVDSSITLACLAPWRTATRVACVNYHSPGVDSDERHFARLAAARARRELVERERDPGFRLESLLGAARTPSPLSYVGRLSARVDAGLASSHRAQALFTGGGGDQLFFQLRECWPAADYLRLRGIDTGFFTAAMDAARLGRVSVWRAIALALSDRLRTRTPSLDIHQHWALATDLVRDQATQRDRFDHPCLQAASGLPIGKLMQVQQLLYPGGYYDPIEGSAAPELVNPLLSQPLVELCLALPSFVLTCGGQGRGLARKAFEQDLPVEIAQRRSKGGMAEHLRTVLLRNLDFARQLLLDGQLVRQGLLDRGAIEAALSGSPRSPVRTGEIHRCIGIEIWLQGWPAPRRSR
jgi:asparagine synthase (glutamine-hydrolysing)